MHSLGHAFRRIIKNPATTLIIVFSIVLGVSTNAVTFGWIEALIINPLPTVQNTDRLYVASSHTSSDDYIDSSYQDYIDYRDGLSQFGDLFLFKNWPVSLQDGESLQQASSVLVSSNYFSSIGIKPVAGRFFEADDLVEVANGKPVVVISEAFWESRYDRDESVIGSPLSINRLSYTVVGVAPRGFAGTTVGGNFQLWLPLMQLDALSGGDGGWIEDRKTRPFAMAFRAGDETSIEQVRSAAKVIASRLAETYPRQNNGIDLALFEFASSPSGEPSPLSMLLSILYLVSCAVLLIICANILNLLLAEKGDREKEISIRKSIGASDSSIFALFLTDGLIYGCVAALLSLVAVQGMSGFLRWFAPDIVLPSTSGSFLTTSLITYTFCLALLSGLAMSLIPAFKASKVGCIEALRENSRGSSGGKSRRWLSSSLIVAQIALAFATLMIAWSFSTSLNKIVEIDTGFEADNVFLVSLTPSGPIESRNELVAYTDKLKTAAEDVQGVEQIAFAEFVPLGFSGGSWEDIEIRGYSAQQDEDIKIYRNYVSEDYFNVMGIDILNGNGFTRQDDEQSATVAVVNEAFARKYFDGRDPVGRTIVGWGREIRVVGVARDSKYRSPTETARPYLYMSFRQFANPGTDAVMHVKHSADEEALSTSIKRKVDDTGSLLYLSSGTPLKNYIKASFFGQSIAAVFMSVLAAAAVVLSAIGIYGVVSHSVSQRSQEVGIRMALGASIGHVIKMILTQSLKVVAIGLLIGFGLFALLWGGIRELLYDVSSLDIAQAVTVALALLAIAAVATMIPSLRLTRLDPAHVLRAV